MIATTLATGFLAGALLTYIFIRLFLRAGVLDAPNERSSHTRPTPRGGGLSVVIVFLVFLLVYPRLVDGAPDAAIWQALLVGGVIIAAVGILDDLNHVPARWRFMVHLVAVVLTLSILPSLPEIPVFGLNIKLEVFGYAVLAIMLVWFINLFNFMDGIDGIAGVEAITALSGAALVMFIHGQGDWLFLFGFLAASVAGFLLWNWPPAKVFMGDACSGFLGFTLGVLAITSSTDGVINVWSWLILFGVFVVDATTTLVMRILRGERWIEAHRNHAYQILSRRFNSHRKVSVGVLVINVVWLLPFAILAAQYPYWAAVICIAALLPLLIIAIRVGAGGRM